MGQVSAAPVVGNSMGSFLPACPARPDPKQAWISKRASTSRPTHRHDPTVSTHDMQLSRKQRTSPTTMYRKVPPAHSLVGCWLYPPAWAWAHRGMASHVQKARIIVQISLLVTAFSLSLDKACSPVLARICFKGPAYPMRLCVFLALLLLLLARAQHIISTSKRRKQQTESWSGSRPARLTSSPPPVLPCCLDSGRPYSIAKHSNLRSPCRHVIPHGQPLLTVPPLFATQDMPNHAIHNGPMAQWRQSVNELLRVKSQASRGHTILLGHFQKYHPTRTAITTPGDKPV